MSKQFKPFDRNAIKVAKRLMTLTNSDDIEDFIKMNIYSAIALNRNRANPTTTDDIMAEEITKRISAAISKKIVEARIEELKNMPMTYEYSDEGDNFDTELNKWRQDRLKQLRSNDNE